MNLPIPLIQLIDELAKLPGIGKKTAKRLAFSLLLRPEQDASALAASILKAREAIRSCSCCFGFTDMEICDICADPRRNHEMICVIEDPRNIFTIEKSNVFTGVYHVLQGAISPLQGITPENLRIAELQDRIQRNPIQELVISTNPTLEGEATAHYLMDLFKDKVPVITRIARGMPAGGDLEFADSNTLATAFEGRTPFAGSSED
ncbi:MAG: recombination protein RecR [Deltaproteobacteria bacterium]|jgi:recombination protein RecR|nr:recombination protein RecR [Deltaproteobacteria bacterium]MBT4264857.1 recombination protein RecR [Deltaproteobacteria bacterium]MBT4640057.1 recombination protein RecR [Deltaproteobacteria bacterium]MBT6612593.1 recombination protein RecR [Deltaproteobacteria bacterium]MBT7153170.1 recombination protein RecR [Deltaproteobacteria bacterium]